MVCVGAFGNLRLYRTETSYDLAWVTHGESWEIISRELVESYPLTLEGQARAITALWGKGAN